MPIVARQTIPNAGSHQEVVCLFVFQEACGEGDVSEEVLSVTGTMRRWRTSGWGSGGINDGASRGRGMSLMSA